jgi:hypothetical protein
MIRKILWQVAGLLVVMGLAAPAGWAVSTFESSLTITDLTVTIERLSDNFIFTPTSGFNYTRIIGQVQDTNPDQTRLDNESTTILTSPNALNYTGGPWFTSLSSSVSYSSDRGAISLQVQGNAPEPSGAEFGVVSGSSMGDFHELEFPYITAGNYEVRVTGNYTYQYKMTQDPGAEYSFAMAYFQRYAAITGIGIDGELIPHWGDYFSKSVDSGALTGVIDFTIEVTYESNGPQKLDIGAMIYQDGGVAPVPLPGAAWLLGSGLAGLLLWRRRRQG